ncbi:hypothetical protein EVA_04907 [gut metagenome]|uniref:Uncharacterized protein n=1 Tax=gut metagenome TaxID=749906 RepID=J9D2X4_9ZZZZ
MYSADCLKSQAFLKTVTARMHRSALELSGSTHGFVKKTRKLSRWFK